MQSVWIPSEDEERWIDLVRIVDRDKGACSEFKFLPRHLVTT